MTLLRVRTDELGNSNELCKEKAELEKYTLIMAKEKKVSLVN